MDIQRAIDRALQLSHADACIVIAEREAAVNVRWANNTVTTNGTAATVTLSIASIVGRRIASVRRTYVAPDQIEEMVRASEAGCARRPDAPDYMPLFDAVEDSAAQEAWGAPPVDADIHVFDQFSERLGAFFARARRSDRQTFGYAAYTASTLWLATSTGLRRRHSDRIGKVEITAKTPDFSRSSWTGATTRDFGDVDLGALFDRLDERISWSARGVELPPGHYEVLLEPSCTADLALGAYHFMTRRDADEGRSPYSRPGGGTRIGDRLFGRVSLYSDPSEPDIRATPFHAGIESGSAWSVFDNGVPLSRTDWVRDGELRALIMPRYWAARAGEAGAVPYVGNLVVPGGGATLEEMIAQTERALLVTCFWYIRTVDPETALQTGLTRDGVFLVESGKVTSAVNNFRWNMSPIAAFAQATQIGRSGLALPREYDEFLRTKAPPVRIERFHMSSPSQAT
jgi:predicted Zn-dependent protease